MSLVNYMLKYQTYTIIPLYEMKITTYFKAAMLFTVIAGLFMILSYSNAFWAAAPNTGMIGISYQVGLWTVCFGGNCTSMAKSDNPGERCHTQSKMVSHGSG